LERSWHWTCRLDGRFSPGEIRLGKFHLEILHLDRARSAVLKEGPASPLLRQFHGVRVQQLGEVLKVFEANPRKETDRLDPSDDQIRSEAFQEGMILCHRDFIAGETF
jgi:hypothetical protein